MPTSINYLIAFGMGVIWQGVLAYNTRAVASGKSMVKAVVSQVALSLLWGLLIRTIMLSPEVIYVYAIGTGIGVVIGIRLSKN